MSTRQSGLMDHVSNIFQLGIKEFKSLLRDPTMVILIIYSFSLGIYIAGEAQPDTLTHAPVAIIDEDQSVLSSRIVDSMYPPHFQKPVVTTQANADSGMDRGIYSFTLDIPPNFQRDVLAGREPAVQLNADATIVSQAFIGVEDIQNVVTGDVNDFIQRNRTTQRLPVELDSHILYNPNSIQAWFASVMEIINNVTMLSIILTGAALIREREHGTIEHLLVMPLQPYEIVLSKVWSMAVVVLIAAAFAVEAMVRGFVGVHVTGSALLFLVGVGFCLMATTSMGILLGTIAKTMPQFGLLMILILLPLEILSGALTPRESMPIVVQKIMLVAPTTYFVKLSQAILYRGAGISVVWPDFLALFTLAAVFFTVALVRFRNSIGSMQS